MPGTINWNAELLLAWYDNYKRHLPWRERKDAYAIWVSEIMLQQTRVDTVIPYYQRWMQRFPNLEILAQSEETEVVRYWEGLGYYSRARNLRRGAIEVLERFGGQVPRTTTELRSLSGIGEYTAGAIMSIAYNERVPAVDGNVLRIISRLENISDDIAKLAVKRQITVLVHSKIPGDRPGDFNQALMDLGASICLPRAPLCNQCPISGHCEAFELEIQQTLPVKAPKNKPEPVFIVAGILRDGAGRFLLRKRPEQGLLAGMWEFPSIETADKPAKLEDLKRLFSTHSELLDITEGPFFATTHTFSHRRWFITFYRLTSKLQNLDMAEHAWFDPVSWNEIPFAGPHRQAAMRLLAADMTGTN
ncbi:A/G-specific adenine glycosylase [bacterium BFN5]|nr:A/G-specific adenine glycosylase [bacterium BFN5]